MSKVFVVISLLFLFSTAQAKDPVVETEILAQRGNGVVTQAAFAARAEKIPAKHRRAALRDRNRLRDLITTILLRSQLASDAREAGYDKDQVVIDRMKLAAEAELADAWVQHYVAIQPAADYDALAREYYILHQDEILSSPKINVSHILITSDERPDAEAKTLADSVVQQVNENPKLFDELVLTYSEDPSAKSNKGKFTHVKRGDMVKAFEEAAFALEEGEISEPVKTTYGYHIIRLDAHIAAKNINYDEVKVRLIEQERAKHEDRVKEDYLGSLSALEFTMTEEALREMVVTQFGEDYADPQVDAKE